MSKKIWKKTKKKHCIFLYLCYNGFEGRENERKWSVRKFSCCQA